MQQQSNVLPIRNNTRYFGTAKVLQEETSDGTVRLLWENQDSQQTVNAIIATHRTKALRPGNLVLISGESVQALFVIGVLGNPVASPAGQPSVTTSNGVTAQVSQIDDREILTVYSATNELLFSYDEGENLTKVQIPKGDLHLTSKEGSIELQAAKAVNINGQALNLKSQKLSIYAPYAQMIFGRLESVADTIIEEAKNVFRTVKALSQLRSGRMRVFVDDTYQFKSKKATMKADEDFKVDAEKIHLG